MVAGVRTVHGHPVDTRKKSTAPSSREALAAQLCYAPFDLLLIPYRDRLSHLWQGDLSLRTACQSLLKEPSLMEQLNGHTSA